MSRLTMMCIGQAVEQSMLETGLWQLVKRNLPGHVIRVENTSGSGTPDVNACYAGKETWLELKMAKGNWVHFRTSQVAWFTKRVPRQGRCGVLIRKNDDLYLVRGAELTNAIMSHAVPNKDKSCKIPIADLPARKFSKPWKWDDISEKVYE